MKIILMLMVILAKQNLFWKFIDLIFSSAVVPIHSCKCNFFFFYLWRFYTSFIISSFPFRSFPNLFPFLFNYFSQMNIIFLKNDHQDNKIQCDSDMLFVPEDIRKRGNVCVWDYFRCSRESHLLEFVVCIKCNIRLHYLKGVF